MVKLLNALRRWVTAPADARLPSVTADQMKAYSSSRPNKKLLGVLFRGLFSAVLLAWLFVTIEGISLRQAFGPDLITATLVAGVLITASVLPAAERWRLIARQSGIEISRNSAIYTTLLSYFALQLTPSTIGADAVRIAALRPLPGRWSAKLASILIDRAYGIISIVLLAVGSLPLLVVVRADALGAAVLLTLSFAAAIAAAIVVSYLAPPKRWLRSAVVRAISRMTLAFRSACTDWRAALPFIALSFASHALFFTAFFVVLRGAGAESGLGTVLGAFPTANLAALVPVSINGWGVREAALLPLLGAFQVPAAVALAASVAFGAAGVLSGVAGLLAWLANPRRHFRQRIPRSWDWSLLSRPKPWFALTVCIGMPCVVIASVPSQINQADFLDPLLYSALTLDYGELIDRFGLTYYATRISYIFPAKLFSFLFGWETGYLVFRMVLLTVLTTSVFIFVRRWFGSAVATLFAAVACLGPWVLRSLLWEYVDGVSVTYMFAAIALATTRIRPLTLFLSGVFLALAVNANVMALAFGSAFFPSWMILSRLSPLVALRYACLILSGFLAAYVVLSTALHVAYPEIDLFFERATLDTSASLLAGAASAWWSPLSAVVDAGMFYSFAPFATLLLLCAARLTGRFSDAGYVDAKRFQSAALVYLALVCAGIAVLHLSHVGTMANPWGVIYAFPATLIGWAALAGPALSRLGEIHRWGIVAASIVALATIFATVGAFLQSRVDLFDLYFLAVAGCFLGAAIVRAARPYVVCVALVAGAQLPYRTESVHTGFPNFFSEIHRSSADNIERDVVEGGRALLQMTSEAAPISKGALGVWHPLPAPRYYQALTSFLFYGYSLVMPDAVGLPYLSAGAKDVVKQRPFLLLLAPSDVEIDAGLATLAQEDMAYRVIHRGSWEGDELRYTFAFVELTAQDSR